MFHVHIIGVLHIYLNEDTIQHTNMYIYQIKLLLPPGVLYYCHRVFCSIATGCHCTTATRCHCTTVTRCHCTTATGCQLYYCHQVSIVLLPLGVTVLLPPDVNPIEVNICVYVYIYIYIYIKYIPLTFYNHQAVIISRKLADVQRYG
jgi:hypothetical protein